MARAFVFPGQGSQAVGMGSDLADAFAVAREVFEEVDDALGQSLSRLMREGPEDELTLTENAQPALMAVSLAVVVSWRAKVESRFRSWRHAWPGIHLANTRRWLRPEHLESQTRRSCFCCAAVRCRTPSPLDRAPWRLC